jgi:hypothetical protein
LALIFAINPFLLFFSGIALSRTFFAIPHCQKKMHTFSAGQYSEKSFFPFFPLLHFYFFNEPCQLFISKELNRPVTLSGRSPWFYEGKRRWWRLTTAVYDSPTRSTNFQIQIIQHFACVRSRRDLKEKNYRDGSRQSLSLCVCVQNLQMCKCGFKNSCLQKLWVHDVGFETIEHVAKKFIQES